MNKKLIALIVVIILIVVIGVVYALNNNSSNNNQENIEETNDITENTLNAEPNNINTEGVAEESTSENRKILIAYFSRAGENYNVGNVEQGNTELMAENISEITGGDLFKIEPVEPYPESYSEMLEVAQEEERVDARPQINNNIENFDEYDIIFIGYPIWNGDMPKILYTFLESYDFSGKTVIPFNTHEGSGSSGTYNTIESEVDDATVLDGLAIRGSDAREESSKETIQNWINELAI